ncbi:hypothetical protein GQR58_005063 [Nymphon striatum]|nr:hypothetical protein GQR58_005063 [Nymphon striatum]
MKLLTMEKTNKKKKLTSTQGKVIQYQEQGNIAFQLLVKSQLLDQPISIKELMSYCITPVPHSLGTPDGYMAKTDKSLQVTACVVFLLPHMKRVNYRVAQWKRVTSRNHSLRTRPAWMGIDNQRPLEPVWSEELYFLLYGGNPVRE